MPRYTTIHILHPDCGITYDETEVFLHPAKMVCGLSESTVFASKEDNWVCLEDAFSNQDWFDHEQRCPICYKDEEWLKLKLLDLL